MDFDLTEDQREIKSVAHELLGARSPIAKVRQAADAGQYDAVLWHEIVELGWPGIAVAEEYGGQGLGAVELAVLLEELGYACASTPLLSTAVAAAAIQAGGSDEQRERWLPGLVAGEITAGVGSAELIVDGHEADLVVLIDGDAPAGPGLAGVRARGDDRSDPPLRPVVGLRSGADGRGRGLADGAAARVRAAVAAEVVGVCQRALEMTLEYVKDRKQFGVPGRLLPGGRAPLRADAAAHRERPLDGLLRRLGRRRRAQPPGRGSGPGCRRGRHGRPRGHRLGDPGPRRDRLHLGGRRALAVQARRGRPGVAGRRRAPSCRAGAARGWPPSRRRGKVPPGSGADPSRD